MAVEYGRRFTYDKLQGVTVTYRHVEGQPAFCLERRAWGKRYLYIVTLSVAHEYDPDEKDGRIWEKAKAAAVVLDLPRNSSTLMKLAGIFENHLDDLTKLPPDWNPEAARRAFDNDRDRFGVEMTIDGESVLH